MTKKPNLAEAMKQMDRSPATHHTAAPMAETEDAQPAARKTRPKSAPSRDGRVPVISYQRPEVRKQLHQMKLDLDRPSVEDLLTEALNDLFTKYGKPSIA